MARPTKLTEALTAKICELLSEGLSQTKVCDMVDISMDAFARWMKDNAEFSGAVKKAKAECERWHLNQIKAGSREGHWQASAWFLERTQPAVYGRVAALPAPPTENTVKTKLDRLIEGFDAYVQAKHQPDYIDTSDEQPDDTDDSEADNEQTI